MNTAAVYYWRIRRYHQDRRVVKTPRYDDLRSRFFEDLWRRTAAAMGADIEDIGYGYLRITCGEKHTFVTGSKVQLDDHLSLRIAGNKPLVYQLLKEHHYTVQPFLEFRINKTGKAMDFIKQVGGPCVVKPAAGSGAGNGITTKIETRAQLRRASLWAATFSPRLLIEAEIPGDSYRLLYLNGEFIDAVRRKPPHVTGDGRSTIRQLMLRENERRLKGNPIVSLNPLIVDYESQLKINSDGLQLNTVLADGQKIPVKTVANQNCNLENEPVRDQVHPSIVETGAKIAKLFKLKLAGVDLITPDAGRPLAETGGIIGEINTSPGLHHHYLISDPTKSVNVAQQILSYIFDHS